MVELVVEVLDGTPYSLTVDQNEVIALSKTFLDLTDIDARKGEFTKSFGLPRSEINDLVFGGFGDPSRIGALWNTRFEMPAWIIEDGNLIIDGTLRMEQNDPRLDKYVVSVSGTVTTIKVIFADLLMAALDMTAWTYDPSDIYNSWDGSLFGGDMIFPIHDFGFGYGLYKKVGTANALMNIKTTATPIILDRCIPAFRLNELLRMLFEQRDMVIEGSWFSEDEVEEIYVQADNPLIAFVTGVQLWQAYSAGTIVLDGTVRLVPFAVSPSIPEFNNGLGEYTAPVDGAYYFDITIVPTPGTPNSLTMLVYVQVNGVNVSTLPGNWNLTFSTTVVVGMTAGDVCRVRVQMSPPPVTTGVVFSGVQQIFKLTQVIKSGASVNPAAHWANYKQIDFFRSVLQVFNLIAWQPETNKIRLDTWQYYMDTYGSRKDWTEKVDVQSMIVKPINGELRNPISVSYKDASDILNKDYVRVVGRPYGSYFEDTNIPYTKDSAKNLGIFAPSPVQSIIGSDPAADFGTVLICKYYTDEDSIEYEPPGLQLMYYNGVRSVTPNFYTSDSEGDTPVARSGYPYFSPFRLYSADSWQVQADTLDLSFTYWTPPSDIVDAPSELGIYNRYFLAMMRGRYDEANKIIEAPFVLNAFDINTFSFADTIVININGTPVGLKVLELNDYVPGQKGATKIKAMLTFLDPDA